MERQEKEITPELMPRGIIMPSEELEPVHSTSERSGIAILTAAGLIVVLPRPVAAIKRRYPVLRLLIAILRDIICRSIVIYSDCIDHLTVARISIIIVVDVISCHSRQPSAALNVHLVPQRSPVNADRDICDRMSGDAGVVCKVYDLREPAILCSLYPVFKIDRRLTAG